MNFVVYVLESKKDKTWYIGFTTNLKQRLQQHQKGRSSYTSRNAVGWNLIYAEMYLNKKDALGREIFLKSGSGHRFLRKQLKYYFEFSGNA